MMRRFPFLLALLVAAGAGASAQQHSLSGIVPIRVLPGLTRVLRFAADGRPGIVTSGFRDTGGGHGYNTYFVMLPTRKHGKPDWNVVGMARRDKHFHDLIRDDPGDGKEDVRSLRFAHGVLDGKYETVLLEASKEQGCWVRPRAPRG